MFELSSKYFTYTFLNCCNLKKKKFAIKEERNSIQRPMSPCRAFCQVLCFAKFKYESVGSILRDFGFNAGEYRNYYGHWMCFIWKYFKIKIGTEVQNYETGIGIYALVAADPPVCTKSGAQCAADCSTLMVNFYEIYFNGKFQHFVKILDLQCSQSRTIRYSSLFFTESVLC